MWSIQGDFIYRHHNEPRFQLYVPKEETFAIPLTYIDVTGSTHTELDVLQENVLNRNLSDSWRGFTKFIQQKENTKKDTCGPEWDWQRFKRQPDQIMCIQKFGRKMVMPLRIEISRNGQKRNQKLDNARRLRGFYFIDPDDEEYKGILENATRKLERLVAPATPCKRPPKGITKVYGKSEIASEKTPKTVYECMVESHESTRQQVESSPPKIMKTTLQAKGLLRCHITIWSTSLFLCHKRWKFRMQEAAVDKEWKTLETIPAWQLEKDKSKKDVILEAPTLTDTCHLKNAELEPKLQKKKQRQSRAPWWHCERRLWSLHSFNRIRLICVANECSRSNECYCKISRLWRTSSWCSIRVHSGKTGGRSQIAQHSHVRMSRRMDTSSTTWMAQIMGKHWRSRGTFWTKFMWSSVGRIVMGKKIRRSCARTWLGVSTKLRMHVRSSKTWVTIVGMCGWYRNGWKEAKYGSYAEEIHEKRWSWRTNFICWSRYVFNVNANRMKSLLNNLQRCLNHVFLLDQLKNNPVGKRLRKLLRGRTTWKALLKNALSDTVTWQTRKWSNFYKVSSPCLDDHQFKQE